MSDIVWTQGETAKIVGYQLTTPDPTNPTRTIPLDLTNAEHVRFRMWPMTGGGRLLGGLCAILVPREGIVAYAPTDVDLSSPVLYWGTFEVMYPQNRPVTRPEGRYLSVRVFPRLGPAIP